MAEPNPLRRRRTELGLTQAELAASAGISRQMVAAVELGINVPAVDAALRLAQALECSLDELFDEVPREPVPDNSLTGTGTLSQNGAFVVTGCDPALAVAEAMLPRKGRGALLALEATSGTALRSLRQGHVHAAVVHGRPGQLKRATIEVIRLQRELVLRLR